MMLFKCRDEWSTLSRFIIKRISQDAPAPIIDLNLPEIKKEFAEMKKQMVIMKCGTQREYRHINVNLDKIYRILNALNVCPSNNKPISQPSPGNLLQTFTFPLASCEEIQALDNQIQTNPEFKLQLITFLSKIGGTSREDDGGKVVYKVVDQVFNPLVLVNYTWTGVSRGKDNLPPKKPFQSLEGILDVFFQVISLADSRHTKQKNENIFKNGILKYATKRSVRKSTKFGRKQTSLTPIQAIGIPEIEDDALELENDVLDLLQKNEAYHIKEESIDHAECEDLE
ncbi:uncharacterized protein [Euwallacea similis]|uniref:uncharacterized protein n=1 Tax=Euwallacea similis TaxID=1736056 RepID=UPI00344D0FB0